MHRISWWSPPFDVLKLNFDGSFVPSIRRGGIGGAIRDWNGNVIRSFSSPFESLDANEVEAFALLVGCRELGRMGGYNAILERDSFSVIQWGIFVSLEIGGLGTGGAGNLIFF